MTNLVVKLIREEGQDYGVEKVTSPEHAVELAGQIINDADREMMICICLDTRNQPIGIHTVSIGSLDSSIVHPREVFKVAMLSNAKAIILAHNHPSGDTAPSSEDHSVTDRIQEAGDLLGISLLDHIIISAEGYYSFREAGDIGSAARSEEDQTA